MIRSSPATLRYLHPRMRRSILPALNWREMRLVCFLRSDILQSRAFLTSHPCPMRCLVVADLHYSLPQLDWLVSAAPQFDLVIFAGDALDVGSFVDFRAQIVVVKKYLSLLSGITKVILCSGNHDLDERSAEGEKIS